MKLLLFVCRYLLPFLLDCELLMHCNIFVSLVFFVLLFFMEFVRHFELLVGLAHVCEPMMK